jgi:DNA-binding winged helix-turn-helix (wHTH) protein/WD40 repeat protein
MDGEFRIGPWLVQPSLNLISQNGTTVHLEPKVMEVLVCLAQRAGEPVPREELIQTVWPGTFVTDDVLKRCISELRRVFEDDAREPRIIETIPKRGYRLLVPIEEVQSENSNHSRAAAAVDKGSAQISPAARSKRKPLAWGVAALAVAGSCLAAGYLLGKRRTAAVTPPSFTRLTYQRGIVFSARFAPDGHVVYGASWDNKPIRLFTTRSDFPESLPLDLRAAHLLAISRKGEMALALNGTLVSFPVFLNGMLARAPLAGGAPREMIEDVRYADWDPRGELAVVHHVAGQSRLEYPIGKVLYQTSGWISHIRLSPHGGKIAFLDHPFWAEDVGSVAVVDLAGNKKTLSTGWTTVQGLAWSPKGDEVWFTASKSSVNRDLLAVDLSGKQRTVLGMPGALTLQDIAADGRVLLSFEQEREGVVAFNLRDKSEKDLSWFDSTMVLDISADGQRVLLDEQGGPTGSDFYVGLRNIDGSPPVHLGEGEGGGFSPDEHWTASAIREASESIMLLPIGAGQPREIKHKGIENATWGVHFMPGGRQLVYAGIEPGHSLRTYVQDLDGDKPRAVTPEGANARFPSPEGKYLAGLDAENNLTVYDVETGEPHVVPDIPKGFLPTRWSPDARHLYVYRRSDVPCKVYRVDWRTGRKEFVQELVPSDAAGVMEVFPVVMTPDAKLFVYSFDRILSELYVVAGLH